MPFEVALSIRNEHASYLDRLLPLVDAVELIVDESRLNQKSFRQDAANFASEKAVIFHSLDLSPASADLHKRPNIERHLESLRHLMDSSCAGLVTDHLSFSRIGATSLDNFVPAPFDEEGVQLISKNLNFLKSRIGGDRKFGVENVCYYLSWPENSLTEVEFLNAVLEQSEGVLLLDVNNLYINAVNHKYDPYEFIRALRGDQVVALHLGGHDRQDGILMDTHSKAVNSEVWSLFEYAIQKTAALQVILEWDFDFDTDSIYHHLIEIRRRISRPRCS